ncbi:MAG TPA: hypothetical protein VGW77_22335 [Candidatus Binatia bacterium]|nr:hypothetical protein [Candidatus Binatia bacterium]
MKIARESPVQFVWLSLSSKDSTAQLIGLGMPCVPLARSWTFFPPHATLERVFH